MTIPTLVLALLIASLYGALYHLIRGGGLGRLFLFLFFSWVGFALGHLIGIWQELKVPIGATEEEERWFYDEVLNRANYDGFGHVHNFHDSYLELNGKTYALSEFSNFARLSEE